MNECLHDYVNAVHTGKYSFVCPNCGADISTSVFMMYEAIQAEQKGKQDERNGD